MIERTAEAEWKGTLASGGGKIRLGSGTFEGDYSFATRFGSDPGTNPEELIAGAHAGCFSMALSLLLGSKGHAPTRIHTTGRVGIEKQGEGFRIVFSHLKTRGEVPGLDAEAFQAFAEQAKRECPVSQALTGVEISLDARLVEQGPGLPTDEPGMLM